MQLEIDVKTDPLLYRPRCQVGNLTPPSKLHILRPVGGTGGGEHKASHAFPPLLEGSVDKRQPPVLVLSVTCDLRGRAASLKDLSRTPSESEIDFRQLFDFLLMLERPA